MGIAEAALHHPASFKRKCTQGETTTLKLRSDGKGSTASIPSTGHNLFTLLHDGPDGHRMLAPDQQAVLTSSHLPKENGYEMRDRNGVLLGTAEGGRLFVNNEAYEWKKASSFVKGTVFRLKYASQNSTSLPLAELSFTGSKRTAEMVAHPSAIHIPLGIIVFQALVFHERWVNLPAFKRIAFSSVWT